MSRPQDHFSAIAGKYSQGRFGYPDALFDYLVGLCRERTVAWDCATGSGQAAVSLARSFGRIVATDISSSLLACAPIVPNVTYRCAPAEDSGLPSASVNLVAVAQALHWFDQDRFWNEVNRVCKPGAVLAFWGYNWPNVSSTVDAQLAGLRTLLQPHWPERSVIIHGEYATVRPPFAKIASPAFSIVTQWRRQDYLAHLASWSAVRYFREHHGSDPLQDFGLKLAQAWPDGVELPHQVEDGFAGLPGFLKRDHATGGGAH